MTCLMRSALLLLLLIPAACSNLLPELAGPPPALYQLTAPAHPAVPPGQPVKSQLLVDVPQASAGIDTPRIALMEKNGAIGYYKDVSWTDRAPVMFQTMLVNTFDHTGLIPAVGRDNVGLRADFLLKTDISALQADYKEGTPPTVKVALRAKLISMPRRIIIAGNEFSEAIPAEADTITDIDKAFQQASATVLTQLADWTVARIREEERHRPH